MMEAWRAALRREKELHPDREIDEETFRRGWLWGNRFAEYRRWFKEEYWEMEIKTDPVSPAQAVP